MEQAVLPRQVDPCQRGEKAGAQHTVHHPAGIAAAFGVVLVHVDGGNIAGELAEGVHHLRRHRHGELLGQAGGHVG